MKVSSIGEGIALVLVFAACIPVLVGLLQYALLPFAWRHAHLDRTSAECPCVAIVIPAWNEAMVLEATIERLTTLEYPTDKLRIYVVDDASTDATPELMKKKMEEYPKRVFHLRREKGGEGKAHTLNYGLSYLWSEDWCEAVLIMDADVIYTKDSLKRMVRHLADPSVGAVTAYIKEGSASPNFVQRYIGFEYITATGASRRAQNVLGFLACLSGGAQLHRRENFVAIGGKIFSNTLAEDTFTTFLTQLTGRKAIFEPLATVYAEEPDDLNGLWKQRLRWARGNVQITRVFRHLWCNTKMHPGLGSLAMTLMWFSIFLMPIFQISASIALLYLYSSDAELAWIAFRAMWIVAAIAYLVVTLVSCLIDVESAKRTWLAGVLFPGGTSLIIIVLTLMPNLRVVAQEFMGPEFLSSAEPILMPLVYAWQSLAMVTVYLAKEIEVRGASFLSSQIARLLLFIGGYGAFLCAVTFGAYIKELLGAEMKWDKTIKTGKVS